MQYIKASPVLCRTEEQYLLFLVYNQGPNKLPKYKGLESSYLLSQT